MENVELKNTKTKCSLDGFKSRFDWQMKQSATFIHQERLYNLKKRDKNSRKRTEPQRNVRYQ